MALRWFEGFETHRTTGLLARKYASTTGTTAVNTAAGRISGSSVTGQLVLVTKSLGLNNTWILGFGLFVPANFTASTNGIYLEKGALEQLHIGFVNTAGSFNLTVQRGATVLGTTTANFAYNQWHYFELKAVIRTSTNGSYELRQNEINVLSASGVNTANAGSDGADIWAMRLAANLTVRWDDIYVCDDVNLGDGLPNNDFKGDSQIRGGRPNAAGDVQQFTPGTGVTHHTLVDDTATAGPTDGTDVVFDDTNGHKELFEFEDLAAVNGNIYGLMIHSQLAMNAAGARTLKHVYRNVANAEFNPANFVVNSTAYTEFQDILPVDPLSTLPWTETNINNAQFGVEVVS